MHIPLLPEQATDGNHPSMSLDMIVAGLKLVAQVVIDHESDVVVSGGQIC
ncbi:pyroglutamyl peptidase family protein [Vibrio parahaemolyticus V-223/04]|nr:pyroglutamyl peptidase family protein [Vibrio parahaemolyticus V-223/04]